MTMKRSIADVTHLLPRNFFFFFFLEKGMGWREGSPKLHPVSTRQKKKKKKSHAIDFYCWRSNPPLFTQNTGKTSQKKKILEVIKMR